MFIEYCDSDINNIVQNQYGGKVHFYNRYTNVNGFKFYLLRYTDVMLNYKSHKPKWYINFFGFFKHNSEFSPRIVSLTFGVAEVFKDTYKLNNDNILREYLYGEGEYQFRSLLNSINEISTRDKITIARYGEVKPFLRNGIIVPNRNRGDEERLIRIAEKEFAKTILDNNGMKSLKNIDFADICFVPQECIRNVEMRLIRPEYMDTEFGILTEKGKSVLNSIIRDKTESIANEQELLRIIVNGESDKVEFKSTLRWNIKDNRADKEIEFAVIKTVAGFLNANGGTLIIGVNDEGTVLGLELDYNSLKDKNWDKFQLCLTEILWNAIPKDLVQSKITITLFEIDGKDICVLIVKPSTIPVFIDRKNQNKFFVRVSNSTRELEEIESITRYCIERYR